MTQLKRLFTKNVNITKNGGTSQIRISSDEFKDYSKVKAVVYGIVEKKEE